MDKAFYANQIKAMGSPFDVVILLQRVTPIFGDDGTMSGKEIAEEMTVTMSYQHTKAMLKALNSIIDAYEKDFGSISTEPKPKGK